MMLKIKLLGPVFVILMLGMANSAFATAAFAFSAAPTFESREILTTSARTVAFDTT